MIVSAKISSCQWKKNLSTTRRFLINYGSISTSFAHFSKPSLNVFFFKKKEKKVWIMQPYLIEEEEELGFCFWMGLASFLLFTYTNAKQNIQSAVSSHGFVSIFHQLLLNCPSAHKCDNIGFKKCNLFYVGKEKSVWLHLTHCNNKAFSIAKLKWKWRFFKKWNGMIHGHFFEL